MTMRRRVTFGCMAAAGLLQAGCVGQVLSLFDQEFLNSLGLGNTGAAEIPGEAPSIEVRFENRTSRTVEMQVSYRTGGNDVETLNNIIFPGVSDLGEALVCPVDEMTLGDVTDADAIGALVRLGNGDANSPFIEVEPLGVILKDDGVNYSCGDTITFVVDESSATSSGYQVFAFIRRSSNSVSNTNSNSGS
ncbi:MAG: hypothetical protein SF069_02850 [Phycisphaerae bacterium]|nr:hypothetical protein [Phycisphaerae bacterium]